MPSHKSVNLTAGGVTPFIENKDYGDYTDSKRALTRKNSKVEDDVKSPEGRSVRFYASKAYTDAYYKKANVLDSNEKLWPLDKTDKALQDHFVSL